MANVEPLGVSLLAATDMSRISVAVVIKYALCVLQDANRGRVARLPEVAADNPLRRLLERVERRGLRRRKGIYHCHSGCTSLVNARSTMAVGNTLVSGS